MGRRNKVFAKNPEYHTFELLYENGPQRGEPVGYVPTTHRDEYGQRNILLTLDHEKTIIRIDISRVQDD